MSTDIGGRSSLTSGVRGDNQITPGSGTLVERIRAARGVPTATLELARVIESGDNHGLALLRLSVLATFTAEPMGPYLVVEGAARGLNVETRFAPFNQLELQVLDEASPLYKGAPDVILIGARLEELAPRLVHRFAALRAAEIAEEIEAVCARLRSLMGAIREHTEAALLVWNFARPMRFSAGLADSSLRPSQALVIDQLNSRLAEIAEEVSHCYVVDFAALVSERGIARLSDRRMWLRARMPFGAEGLSAAAYLVARYLAALRRIPKKCLVLDLDDTLWGGVLGEDGPGGIRIGMDHPGTVYRAFQEYLLSLRDRGVLLALASKNDREEALRVLATHPDCVLRPELFSAIEIGWGDKATSIQNIARSLSIGLDTLVFFDDSPVEREWIRTQLPQVTVIDAPADPVWYADAIESSEAFDTLRTSAEDQRRAVMYQQESQRRQLHTEQTSLESFLRELDIEVRIGTVGPPTLPRVAQLIAKTNQFNTTSRRHTEAQIEQMVNNGAIGVWARVSDRFGDSGLVGVALALPDGADGTWRIDVLLLSCRVIARGVESTLLSEVARRVRQRGGRHLVGEFLRTPRNEPAETVFRDHGFAPMDDGGRLWLYDLADPGPRTAVHIKVKLEDERDD
jgi:FkbH-like protein